MEMKLPYYMTYPTPFLFSDERVEERDYAYLRSMYPDMARRILPYVEEECGRQEYEGSMIFDEYPDKLQLHLLCGRVYEKVMEEEKFPGLRMAEEEPKEGETAARARGRRRAKADPVRDMVELLLYQELLRRRNERRRCRSSFGPIRLAELIAGDENSCQEKGLVL